MPRPKKEKPNHGQYYEVKVTVGHKPDGKPLRKSFYSTVSKDDARRQGEEYRVAQEVAERTKQPFVTRECTFKEYAEHWLKTYVKGTVRNNTYDSTYDVPVRLHLIPEFGAQKLTEITTLQIQSFLDRESTSHATDTVKKYYRCLKRIFEAAVEDDLCWKNPVTSRVKVKPGVKGQDKRFYTERQRDLVLEYAKTHPKGLSVVIMLMTGISRSELLGLRWEDITEDLVLHVRRGVTAQKNPKTGKQEAVPSDDLKTDYRPRNIPIPQWLYDMVQAQSRQVKLGGSIRNKTPVRMIDTQYIIHGSTGKIQYPPHWSRYVYDAFMKDMIAHYQAEGIDIPHLTPHELRHTAATLWGLNGVDVYTIAKLGGWGDLRMLSQVYGHADVEAMRNALGYCKGT